MAEQQTAWDGLIARVESLVDAGVEDCQGVLAGMARLVVPEYADFCLVDLNGLEPPIRLFAEAEGGQPNVVFGLPESSLAAAMQETEPSSLKAEWLSDTAVTVPVKSGARSLGIVSLINRSTERPYGLPSVNMAEALATQVATLATRAEAYQAAHSLLVQAEAKAGRLRLLAGTALKIQSASSVPVLLQDLADGARAVTGAAVAFVTFGPDPLAAPIQAVSLADRHADRQAKAPPAELKELVEQVCRTNAAVRLTRMELTAREKESLPLAGWLAYPLKARNGRNVGLVHVSAKESGEFSTEDEDLIGQVAEMGANGLENMQLWRSAVSAEERARTEADMARAMTESIGEGIYAVDRDGNCTFINPAAEQLLGWNKDEILGRNMHETVHYQCLEVAGLQGSECQLLGVALRGIPLRKDDEMFVRRDGTPFPVAFSSSPITVGGQVTGAVVVFYDITERKVLEEQLAHKAFHDQLTKLPNRTLFENRLEQALVRVRRQRRAMAVLFLDLDGFKGVNDRLGHQVGDELLIAVAQRLSACVRAGDTVARLSGDEFTLLLEEVSSPQDASRVAERVAEAIRKPFQLGANEANISASIGIAVSDGSDRPELLMKRADSAMYRAKTSGKNRCEIG